MGEVTRFPWEQTHELTTAEVREIHAPPDTIALLQRDVAYMVTHTAILVHSNQAALSMLVNTPRGQIVPRGECKFTDGSTFELQDVGMPQPNSPTMTVQKLMAHLWDVATQLGLEIAL